MSGSAQGMRRGGSLAVAAALLLSVAACSSEPNLEQYRDQPFAVYAAQPSSAGYTAAIEGTLRLSGGCLVLVTTYNVVGEGVVQETVVPAFPSYLTPRLERTAAGLTVLHLGNTRYTVSDHVSWGGSYPGTVDELRDAESPKRTIPAACPGELEIGDVG